MTGHWMQQTAAAIVGVHLLAAVAVAAVMVALVFPVAHRRHIRRSQVLITRIALIGTHSSALTSPEGGQSATGAGTPDPAPVAEPPTRVRVSCTVGVPLLAGRPWRYPAWPHLMDPDTASARDPLTGPAREVGTPDLPKRGVPTSSTSRSDMTWAS